MLHSFTFLSNRSKDNKKKQSGKNNLHFFPPTHPFLPCRPHPHFIPPPRKRRASACRVLYHRTQPVTHPSRRGVPRLVSQTTPNKTTPPAGAEEHRRGQRPRKRAPVSYSTPCRGIRRPPSCAPAGRQKRGQPASARGRCPRLSSYAPGGAQAVSAANDMDCHATP